MIVPQQELELIKMIKKYEQKFCSVSQGLNRIVFIISIDPMGVYGSYIVRWTDAEDPTSVRLWEANLKSIQQTLEIIC